jgi:hypothetical protein
VSSLQPFVLGRCSINIYWMFPTKCRNLRALLWHSPVGQARDVFTWIFWMPSFFLQCSLFVIKVQMAQYKFFKKKNIRPRWHEKCSSIQRTTWKTLATKAVNRRDPKPHSAYRGGVPCWQLRTFILCRDYQTWHVILTMTLVMLYATLLTQVQKYMTTELLSLNQSPSEWRV